MNILDLSKIRKFTEDDWHVFQMMVFVIKEVENAMKREKMLVINQHLLLFSGSFQMPSFTGLLKASILWQRANFLQMAVLLFAKENSGKYYD